MVYLISVNYNWLLSVDLAFCESYTCYFPSFESASCESLSMDTTSIRCLSSMYFVDVVQEDIPYQE